MRIFGLLVLFFAFHSTVFGQDTNRDLRCELLPQSEFPTGEQETISLSGNIEISETAEDKGSYLHWTILGGWINTYAIDYEGEVIITPQQFHVLEGSITENKQSGIVWTHLVLENIDSNQTPKNMTISFRDDESIVFVNSPELGLNTGMSCNWN